MEKSENLLTQIRLKMNTINPMISEIHAAISLWSSKKTNIKIMPIKRTNEPNNNVIVATALAVFSAPDLFFAIAEAVSGALCCIAAIKSFCSISLLIIF